MSDQLKHLQSTVSALVPAVESVIKALVDTRAALSNVAASADSPEEIAAIDSALAAELANLQSALSASQVPAPAPAEQPAAPPAV